MLERVPFTDIGSSGGFEYSTPDVAAESWDTDNRTGFVWHVPQAILPAPATLTVRAAELGTFFDSAWYFDQAKWEIAEPRFKSTIFDSDFRKRKELEFPFARDSSLDAVFNLSSDLGDRLRSIAILENNWDSYGAASFGDDVIESTAILLLQMSQQMVMDKFDPFIVPTVDGGIGVDFEESNISITVSADGQSFEITGSDDHDSPTLSSISDVSSVVTRMIDGDPALDN